MRKIGMGFFLLLMIAGTALAQDVKTDYDHHANFSEYKTYMWIKRPTMQDPLMVSRVEDAINSQLQAKGWRLVNENADVGIAAHGATQQKQTLDTFYDGFGGGWGWRRWGGGLGEATTTTENYTVGTLLVDLFDTKTKQVIWRSTASATLSDKADKNTDKLNKAVDKMFKNFPPK